MENHLINPDELQIEIKDSTSIKQPQLSFTIPMELTKDLHLYELEYITSIIQTYFPLIDYSIFKTEKDILNHFHLCESLCLSFISKIKNPKRRLYKNIIYKTLNDIFNSSTNAYCQSIRNSINSINPSSFKSKDSYNLELYRKCKTNAIPKFLLQKKRKKLKSILYISKYEQFLHSFYLREEVKTATNHFMSLYNGIINPFGSFQTNTKLLFAVAILSNHSNLRKSTFALIRLKNKFNEYKTKFLLNKDNDRLALMTYDDMYLTYIDIHEKEAKQLLQVSIEIILSYANNSIEKLIDIFISFFFVFRGGDAREVVFIKNIVIALKSQISTPPFDIQTIFSYIESLNVILYHSNLENMNFDYKAIHYYLSNSPLLSQEYQSSITKLEKIEKLRNNSIINNIVNMFIFSYSPFTLIQLTPLSNITHSNTITILIDGYLSESKAIQSYAESVLYSETRFEEFYCFKWPSDNFIKSIAKIVIKSVDASERSIIKNFTDTRVKAKFCGRILGLMLYSKLLFPWHTFNLIGYSLGSHVIKHCLKQINKLNETMSNMNNNTDKETLIANVLFIGGATEFANSFKWSTLFDKSVSGRIINCYSEEDNILSYCYRLATGKTPIGIQTLDNPRVDNYDLSKTHIGHLDYWKNFKEIINKVNLF